MADDSVDYDLKLVPAPTASNDSGFTLPGWAQGLMAQVVAGAVYKHTGLNTINRNNTPASVDPRTGYAYADGVPVPTLDDVAGGLRTAAFTAGLNTTTIVAIGVAGLLGLFLLLRK